MIRNGITREKFGAAFVVNNMVKFQLRWFGHASGRVVKAKENHMPNYWERFMV